MGGGAEDLPIPCRNECSTTQLAFARCYLLLIGFSHLLGGRLLGHDTLSLRFFYAFSGD